MILGVGIDFIEVDRFDQAIARHGPKFLERIFTDREIQEGNDLNRKTQGWAARFAAKEAVFKALNCNESMIWHEIELISGRNPFPEVVLGPFYRKLIESQAPTRFHLSISHTQLAAMATAILEKLD